MKQRQSHLGFTLIELLVVVSIIALVSGVGVSNFRDFGRRQEVDNYARSLVSDIRATHADAAAGRRVSGCTGAFEGYAVDFNAVSSGGGSQSTSFTISAVCQTASVVTNTKSLPSDLLVLINRVPVAGKVRLLFKTLELGTDVPAANPLTLTVSSTVVSQTKQITVGATGQIQ